MSPRAGAFDDPIAITPNLDRLAKKGIHFDNAFTAEGVCAPSRVALITGVHQNTLGAQHMRSKSSHWPLQYLAAPPANVKPFQNFYGAAVITLIPTTNWIINSAA
jgi:N-sulfoglucosamine sulfohydrolase